MDNNYPITITICGDRGIGKTTVLKFLEKALQEGGYKVSARKYAIGFNEVLEISRPPEMVKEGK